MNIRKSPTIAIKCFHILMKGFIIIISKNSNSNKMKMDLSWFYGFLFPLYVSNKKSVV